MSSRAERDKAYRVKNAVKFKAHQKKWRSENAAYLKEKEAKRRLEKRALCLIATTRTRARKKGLAFDLGDHVLGLQDRINAGRCELSGTEFDLSPGRKAFSPSLDRRDPKVGYIYSNIRVVCHAMNVALGDWGEDDLATVMTRWISNRSAS